MENRVVLLAGLAFAVLSLMGCGGGGGSAAPASSKTSIPTTKLLSKIYTVATLRNTRSAFAISGLGIKATTRAVSGRMGSRAAMLVLASKLTRDVVNGYDSDTQLYYVITVNADGSGVQSLFTDSAHTIAAGSFTWGAPKWHNNVVNSYPAVYTITYSITGGPFAGDSGTLTITLNNSLGTCGALKLLNLNSQGEHSTVTANIVANDLACTIDITLPNAEGSCYGTIQETSNGDDVGSFTFDNGDTEDITVDPSGDGTQTLVVPSTSAPAATGDFNSGGSDTIQYNDDTSETVDVDTGDDSGDSGDSSDD